MEKRSICRTLNLAIVLYAVVRSISADARYFAASMWPMPMC
jgi:hypothetical protein